MSRFLLLSAVALVAACSPYAYNQEISNFSNGVSSLTEAYQSGQKSVVSTATQQQQQAEIAAHEKLFLSSGCDQVDPVGNPPVLKDCGVIGQQDSLAPLSTLQANLVGAGPVFTALQDYVSSLSAITNATDDISLQQAGKGLISSVNNLASAVGSVSPISSSTQIEVDDSTAILEEGVEFYLDSRRYEILKKEVTSIDPAIQTLGKTVESALLAVRAQQLNQAQKDLHASVAPLQTTTVASMSAADYQNKLSALQSKIDVFNQLRSSNPHSVVASMVDAHHQLALALKDDQGQSLAVYTSTVAFLNNAAQLKNDFGGTSK